VTVAFTIYDPDLFDAQVIVERTGHSEFTKYELAALLGLRPATINTMLKRRRIPLPHHTRPTTHYGHANVWTPEQAAWMLVHVAAPPVGQRSRRYAAR
jgi:hypothetical protein